MKLSEVMKNSKIKIHATINGHGILLITKAEVGVRDGLLVDSLTYFDEDLTFEGPAKVVAINKRDGRSYEFTATRIGPVETRYGKFHLIRCTDDGIIINRRNAERYDIDRLGVIRIGDRKDIRNALVYDIYMKGIAFILDSNTETKIGDHIIASFRYDPNYFHFYACEATVVRKFTLNGQPAIGCTLDAMGADLVTLISSKKKEKLGIKVDNILGIEESPDEKIASGDKIPVNYSPQLAISKEHDQNKHAHKWELEEKPKSVDIPIGGMPANEIPSDDIPSGNAILLDEQYLSPDEAADLIPERSVEDILQARAERVANVDELSDIQDMQDVQDISQIVSAEDLAELASIEDRTPGRAPVSKAADAPAAKKPPKTVKTPLTEPGQEEELKSIPERPKSRYLGDLSALEYTEPPRKRATKADLEAVTARESKAFKPSWKTKQKLDFISSMVSDEAMAASLKKKTPKVTTSEEKRAAAAQAKAEKAAMLAAAREKAVRRGTVPIDHAEHQARFVDAYQNNGFPEDYDGYFNQNGNSVDEGLFTKTRDDGFLTPEQIADIIELERISKNE